MPMSFEAEDGRLSGRLGAMLEPELHDALDHPTRREVLRALNRNDQPRGVEEIKTELRGVQLGELTYHLRVLQRAGMVASMGSVSADPARAAYASEVSADGKVKAVLRATEGGDRERREAAAQACASPLLTMFRVPRPVRTIRLRGRSNVDVERDR